MAVSGLGTYLPCPRRCLGCPIIGCGMPCEARDRVLAGRCVWRQGVSGVGCRRPSSSLVLDQIGSGAIPSGLARGSDVSCSGMEQ